MTEMEMAESAMNMYHREEEETESEEEEKEENIDKSGYTSSSTNASEFLKELNLVLILSFLSLSAKERLDFEEIKTKDIIKHPKLKRSVSTLRVNKQEMKVNEFRALDRQTQKVPDQDKRLQALQANVKSENAAACPSRK